MLKKLRRNKKGFTLAELLIVVAIIAVLVAIAIPVFTSQLEKARESADLANCRSAYGELVSAYLTQSNGSSSYTKTATVVVTQQKAGWQSTSDGNAYIGSDIKVGSIASGSKIAMPNDKVGDGGTAVYTLTIDHEGTVTIK